MRNFKSPVTAAEPYDEVGEYWEAHDVPSFRSQSAPAKPSAIESIYYPVQSDLSQKLHQAAQMRGVTAQTLLHLWLQEKVEEVA